MTVYIVCEPNDSKNIGAFVKTDAGVRFRRTTGSPEVHKQYGVSELEKQTSFLK